MKIEFTPAIHMLTVHSKHPRGPHHVHLTPNETLIARTKGPGSVRKVSVIMTRVQRWERLHGVKT